MSIPAYQHEMFAQFGIAAEKAQALEIAAGNVALAFLRVFVGGPDRQINDDVREMFRDVVDDLNQKTFGRLLRDIRAIASIDDTLSTIMQKALERRNYLTHHFFRTHNFAMFSAEGCSSMIVELNQIQLELENARLLLEGMASCLFSIAGLPDDEVIVEQLKNAGKSVDL